MNTLLVHAWAISLWAAIQNWRHLNGNEAIPLSGPLHLPA